VSPRQYRSEGRQAATSETRQRILEAARSLLQAEGPVSFTIDAIAEQAGVARMTVYNQFKSKPGLVEAISDDLAMRGGISRLPEAFMAEDALAGLSILVEVFVRLWESELLVVRRLRALSTLDPELGHEDRNQRRRHAIVVLLNKLAAQLGTPRPEDLETSADLILVLTSFDAFETLSAGERDANTVVRMVTTAMRQVLGLSDQ
jgi:AcrR family transcriptional regulator